MHQEGRSGDKRLGSRNESECMRIFNTGVNNGLGDQEYFYHAVLSIYVRMQLILKNTLRDGEGEGGGGKGKSREENRAQRDRNNDMITNESVVNTRGKSRKRV
ncbi:unnamed protein product [Allacma fusca]|uniref:Uncharacterized protein n=1 Tax=Allacma fusca TaxID=39272 RepID=A0A8J2NIX4_9HEXA|nr:unnamed protein product [Allacma fusca]